MKSCFAKEILSNSFIVNGAPVPFEALPGNHGVIALESPKDDVLIAALNKAANDHVGGIYRMTEEQYQLKKNQAALMPLTQPRKKEMLRSMPKGPLARKQATAEAANVPRDAVPMTNAAATQQANLKEAAMLAQSPAPLPPPAATVPIPAVTPGPEVPVEGFRPATRRISRKPAATTSAPME